MENSVCEDYITEKLWRSFYVGSVPIVYGSPSVDELLPDHKTAIKVDDYATPKDLAKFITELNQNDPEYDTYLRYKTKGGVKNKILLDLMSKREWGINNDPVKGNYFDKFECLICERLHKNIELKQANKPPISHRATKSHYGCTIEKTFSNSGVIIDGNYTGGLSEWRENSYKFFYELGFSFQEVFFDYFLPNGIYNFTAKDMEKKAFSFYNENIQNNRRQVEL